MQLLSNFNTLTGTHSTEQIEELWILATCGSKRRLEASYRGDVRDGESETDDSGFCGSLARVKEM